MSEENQQVNATVNNMLDQHDENRIQIDLSNNEVKLPEPAYNGPEWYYAEGIKGEGAPPDGYKMDKYKSVLDQALAYNHAEKMIGSERKAPENYEIKLSDALEEYKDDINFDNETFDAFKEWAKNSKLSNDEVNYLVNFHLENMVGGLNMSDEEVEAYKKEEMTKLGEEAPRIIEQLNGWAQNNCSEEQQAILFEMADSAEKVQILRKMINGQSSATVPGNVQHSPQYSQRS